ncbi:membrane-targeted effector domain-containing toxin [Pseudomonas sp. NFX98]|uniref:membrane-targeted effector domain-containing toxin n=1 Tax=Pseudomonas sp. NFX98 TaxID=3399122 RepID=UPI0039FD6C85
MSSTETRPLPNAADKAALKAIATTIIQTCPSLQDTAHEVAADLLKKYAITGLDPDKVYFHRFDAAQSSSKAFTGWEHVHATPTSTMTLTQLVIHRFRVADQDNADLLDVYGGFYTVGPHADTYNETNEVRLHGNEVLKYFWSINFSSLYNERLTHFWDKSGGDFRTLAKCNFLIKAVQARDKRLLSDEDFQFLTQAAIGSLTWPVSLQMLQAQHPCTGSVRTLDVAGYVAISALRFVAPKGRQIVYLPGETEAFKVLETATDMHFWMLLQMNKKEQRRPFMTHFSQADRQEIDENFADLLNRLVSTWSKYDHHLINQKNQIITGDAFSWLRDSTKDAMFAEAELSLTSNGDIRKKLWLGYLSAGVKVFGPMAVVGWPVALPVIGASIASIGLNIDQAVNAKTAAERKAGILGAVLSGIDLLFNLLVLKGPGSLEEIGPQIEAAEAKEMADLIESTQSGEGTGATPHETVEETQIASGLPKDSTSSVPDNFKVDQSLGDDSLVREPGKFQGIHQLASNPSTAITLNDSAYYVRYESDLNGRGHWAIIDPANPNAFKGSIPVRLSAEGKWEVIPRLGLQGGMDVPSAAGPTIEPWARLPGTQVPEIEDTEMRAWALGGPDDSRPVTGVDGRTTSMSRFNLSQEPARNNLIRDARTWYEFNPPLPRLPASSAVQFESPAELFETAFAEKSGLIVGESRGSIGSKQLLIENMPELTRRGVKTLYVQELLANVNQLDLDTFARTGEMPEELQSYLKKLDIKAGNDPDGRFNLTQLVKAANAQRIRVQAIDMSTTYNINRSPFEPEPDQQMVRNFFASQVIRFNEAIKGPAKWVALVDRENMSTFRGYRGIGEQTDALSIRIDDVKPGAAQSIAVDPGLAMEYADYPYSTAYELEGLADPDSVQALIRGDWRVQMQTPWAYRTPQDLRALLPEPGMFTFQRYRSSVLVVYRNADHQMADSVIRSTPGGRFNLDTPLGPAYDSMTVDNFEELKQALIAKGMRPMGWPALPDLAQASQRPTIPANWQANELLEGETLGDEPGKFQGIYRLNSNPSTAILLDHSAYYVRWEADINGGGHWAIIDPENPHGFSDSIPVRLNADGEWETLPRGGLAGGGKTPPLRLPASEYDIPENLKAELKEGAIGLDDDSLRDFYDSLNEHDAYRDFKKIRKRLYRDALRFYAELQLPGRPPIPTFNPDASAEEIIEKILEHARGLIIGESHGSIASKQWLIENMELLASKNVKTLYMEHLLTDFHQTALDAFFETGAMDKDLENYLDALDAGNMTDPLGRDTFLQLVKQARNFKIRVQAIDCMASYRLNGMEQIGSLEPAIEETARQKMMNYFARSIIRSDQAMRGAHKWVALMGNSHSNTFEGVAGVSELEEAIGIRVEDVAEGISSGIEPDPGKILPLGGSAFDRSALARGDLRLRIETPWTAQTMPEIETLLSRQGMYTLKLQPGMTFLVHRSRSNALVRTLIESENGRYYIERSNWPSVSGKHYGSVKALLQALDEMGLTLAGWSKPL